MLVIFTIIGELMIGGFVQTVLKVVVILDLFHGIMHIS